MQGRVRLTEILRHQPFHECRHKSEHGVTSLGAREADAGDSEGEETLPLDETPYAQVASRF